MITLYRGDAEKIRKFEFMKTKKNCLFGQGIYLTDNETVADSYRQKGVNNRSYSYASLHGRYVTLFQGSCKNREDAYQKAFPKFLQDFYRDDFQPTARGIKHTQFEMMAKETFKSLIAEGRIQAKYTAYSHMSRKEHKERVKSGQDVYHMEVSYTRDNENITGFITKFQFEDHELKGNIIRIERPIMDHFFWEIAREHRLGFDIQHDETKEILSSMNFYRYGDPRKQLMHTKRNFNLLLNHYPQYGFKGLEYDGGKRVGGLGYHRAFVIWDEQWVNNHKVQRYR